VFEAECFPVLAVFAPAPSIRTWFPVKGPVVTHSADFRYTLTRINDAIEAPIAVTTIDRDHDQSYLPGSLSSTPRLKKVTGC
ncbi:MAG: hypothetical protein ACYTEX_28435, partial [Planctomycetota bacterium]